MVKRNKITHSSLFVVLVLLSIIAFNPGCKGDKTAPAEETVKDIDDFLDDTAEEVSDELSDLTDLTSDEFEEEQSYEELDEAIEKDITDLTAPVEEKVKEYKPAAPSKPKVSSSSSGGFLLVAGNYSIHENAASMRSKLKRMGYSASEIVNFDNSSFSTVLAGRYSNYEAAARASNELKGRGIDCYVHTKKD